MTRKTTRVRLDLFRRRKVRDLSLPECRDQPKRSIKGVNPFQMGVAVLLLVLGIVSIPAGMLGHFSIQWISSGLSLLGSVAVMAGVFLMIDTIRERKSIDNLVKKAIMRSIHDQN